jgi:hypothetical protein
MPKEKMISARVDDETFEKVQAAADKDRRKLSDWVRLVVMDAVANPSPKAEARPA